MCFNKVKCAIVECDFFSDAKNTNIVLHTKHGASHDKETFCMKAKRKLSLSLIRKDDAFAYH